MVGLSQDFNKLNPLLDKQGNVGGIDDFKSYAAQRYLELKMSKFSDDIFFKDDYNPKYIPMMDNYDNYLKEPINLPAKFPMILNLGTMGIASGFASDIPPHKVDDICNLTIGYIKEFVLGTPSKDSLKKLLKDFRPDFPLGGKITNEASLPDFYIKGQGVIYLEANIEQGVYNKSPALFVKDLPYKVSTSKILNEIKELVTTDSKTKKQGLLADKISDCKDLSSNTEKVNLIIIPKRGVSLDVITNILLENTSLRTSVKYLPNILVGNDLVVNASIDTILQAWLDFRIDILSRKLNYEIHKNSEQVALKKALIKAHAKIDEVVKLIKGSSSKEDSIEKLVKLLDITRREAEYIVSIHLYQISKLEVSKLKDDITKLEGLIKEALNLIKDRTSLLKLIISQLKEIATKYKAERRTSLQNTYVKGSEFDVRSVIESEDFAIAISNDNYVYAKKVDDIRTYNARGAKGSNFIDSKYKRTVRDLFTANSHDNLFVFTDTGFCIEAKGYEFNLWNKPISNIFPEINGKVVSVIKVDEIVDDKYFTFITKKSMMKHVSIKEMAPERKMKGGNIAIKIEEGDELLGVALTNTLHSDRIVITSNKGRMQNLAATDIAPMKRPTRGMPKATLMESEEIRCITVIPKEEQENALILIASSDGYGKLTPLADLPERRGESGKRSLMKIINLTSKDSELIGALLVNTNDHVMTTSLQNKTNKINVELISTASRTARGVRLSKLDEGDKLLNISLI